MPKDVERIKKDTLDSFDAWSHRYDKGILMKLYFNPIQRKVIDVMGPLDGMRVLDIGCGTGKLIEKLNELYPSASYVGLDVNENMLSYAQKRLSGKKNIELAIGDASRLPFRENQFDAVVSTVSFHHWPHQEEALQDIYRILKPNGKLTLADLSKPIGHGKGTNKVLSRAEMVLEFDDAGFYEINQFPATHTRRRGLYLATLGIPFVALALSPNLSLSNGLIAAGLATSLISSGLVYSIPDWTSQITQGVKY